MSNYSTWRLWHESSSTSMEYFLNLFIFIPKKILCWKWRDTFTYKNNLAPGYSERVIVRKIVNNQKSGRLPYLALVIQKYITFHRFLFIFLHFYSKKKYYFRMKMNLVISKLFITHFGKNGTCDSLIRRWQFIPFQHTGLIFLQLKLGWQKLDIDGQDHPVGITFLHFFLKFHITKHWVVFWQKN